MERNLRKRIFEVIEMASTEDRLSRVYDFFMMGTILVSLLPLAGAYILIAALLIFNVEPDSFENFFDAVYWPRCPSPRWVTATSTLSPPWDGPWPWPPLSSASPSSPCIRAS